MPKHGLPVVSVLPLLLCLAGSAGAASAPADPSFALRLFRQVARGTGNVFLSPYSVVSAVAMTAEGARGETARQMSAAMGDTPAGIARSFAPLRARLRAEGRPYELSSANALWVERAFPLRPAYADSVTARWEAGVFEADFVGAAEAARARINRWVEERTRDRIRDLVPRGAVNSQTRLVLANAVYFRGRWQAPFAAAATKPGPFTRANGSKVEVPLMRKPLFHGRFVAFRGVRLLEMPYRGGDLSMVVILPDRPEGLAGLLRKLDAPRLEGWLGEMRARTVDLILPRFRIESDHELRPALSALGMPIAFDPAGADFGGISEVAEPGRLFVSAVLHKAFVDVQEEGTEAAAATVVGVTASSVVRDPNPEKAVFHADHPFLFLIRERFNGAILFIGRVGDPAGT